MTPLSQDRLRALLSAIETLHRPTSLDGFPAAVLQATKQVLACNAICYNHVSLPDSKMTWITEPADALPSPVLREAFNRNLQDHPLIAHSATKDAGRSVRISDFLSQERFHRLALYNEYYRPLNVEYQLGAAISVNPQQMIAVALDRDRPDFTEADRACLDLLRPHMVQAYRSLNTMSLMKSAIEGSGKKLVLVKRHGSGQLASDDEWQVIARYCDVHRSSAYLPDILRNWMDHERSRFGEDAGDLSPSVPLVVSGGGPEPGCPFPVGRQVRRSGSASLGGTTGRSSLCFFGRVETHTSRTRDSGLVVPGQNQCGNRGGSFDKPSHREETFGAYL